MRAVRTVCILVMRAAFCVLCLVLVDFLFSVRWFPISPKFYYQLEYRSGIDWFGIGMYVRTRIVTDPQNCMTMVRYVRKYTVVWVRTYDVFKS